MNIRNVELKCLKRTIAGKSGSFVIFLLFIFSAVIIFLYAVISVSKQAAISESCENLGNIWSESILGEYDTELRSRYGLYGYFGNVTMVHNKLQKYSNYSFKDRDYIKVSDISVTIDEYRLTNFEVLSEQINKTVLSGCMPEITSNFQNDDDTNCENRIITTRWIIDGLPSNKYRLNDFDNKVINSTLQTEYILKFFKDYVDDRDLKKTYFNNEIEYIITGNLNDELCRKGVYTRLLIMRNALNLAYLYSCDEKRQMAKIEAELLTPGPESIITQGLILESWALIESRNDLELLYDGKQVPLNKNDSNWAITLESVMITEFNKEDSKNNDSEKIKYVTPKSVEGLYYKDYLKSLLLTMKSKNRILRIMDLVQINMKYSYCGDFRLEDYYSGVSYSFKVNGINHDFKNEYK